MGGRSSKRSVDISGTGKETDETQPLEGKLEKIEEGAKVAVNGASHSEPKISQLEEQVSNGDPVSLPEPVAVAEVPGPSSPTEEVQEDAAEAEVIQPPKKKEKVKKKWSFRSMSFTRKDKSKPVKGDEKDDSDAVPEVAEEKAEGGGFMSSVTEVIGGATEAVSDAVVSAEHKVEEGLTATQDQVEKISAKVAERAEALVVKMEAMTVKAVDSVQEMMGLGDAAKAETDKIEAAMTEAVTTNVVLPEVNVDSTVKDVTTIKVEMPEVAKSDITLPEVPKIDCVLPDSTNINTVVSEGVTNIILPEVAKIDSALSKNLTTNVELPESVTCEVVLPKDVVLPTTVSVSDEVTISADQELEALSQVTAAVTKGDEMPPPLPASPPPTALIADVISQVVDNAVEHGAEGDNALAEVASEVDSLMRHSVEGEILVQVIEQVDSSVTSMDLPEKLEDDETNNVDDETEQDPHEESAKNASDTSITTEDPTGTAAKKTSEE